MVDQPEYGANRTYLIDIVQISLFSKQLNPTRIRKLYVEDGLSASQLAEKTGLSKSLILDQLHKMGIRKESKSKRATNPKNYRHRMVPYGFVVREGQLVTLKAELRICRIVVDLLGRQELSANAVARELELLGFKAKSGKVKWDHSTVLSIFRRWKDKI